MLFATTFHRFSLRWVVRNPEILHLNETHSHPVFADHVNLFGKNASTTKETSATFIGVGNELDLQVNATRTADQFMPFERRAGQ
jgi:hypothetical protein